MLGSFKDIMLKMRICKYCENVFEDSIEMFRSLKFGHWICQDCFKSFRDKGELP